MYEESVLTEVVARENCMNEMYILELRFEDVALQKIKNKNKKELSQ